MEDGFFPFQLPSASTCCPRLSTSQVLLTEPCEGRYLQHPPHSLIHPLCFSFWRWDLPAEPLLLCWGVLGACTPAEKAQARVSHLRDGDTLLIGCFVLFITDVLQQS